MDKHAIWALQFGDVEDRQKLHEYLAMPQSWNRYGYARGNPLRYVDPDGQEATAAVLGSAAFLDMASLSAAAVALGTGALIGAAGVGGYWVGDHANDIPIGGGRTLGGGISDVMSGVVFVQAAGRSKDFINAKVATVLQHIRTYSPPDPNDPNDRNRKANVYRALKGQLRAAKDKLVRLKGKQRKVYEQLLERTEQQLDIWWGAG